MRIEDELRDLIVQRYGTMLNFSQDVGLANSTLSNIMKNGVDKTSLTNIFKICDALGISVDALGLGKIIPVDKSKKREYMEDIYSDLELRFESSNIFLSGIPLNDSQKERFLFLMRTGIEIIRSEILK